MAEAMCFGPNDKGQNMNPDDLGILRLLMNPVGHSNITEAQSAWLRKVWQQLSRFPDLNITPPSFEGFEANFSRDENPEEEIALYEALASRLANARTYR